MTFFYRYCFLSAKAIRSCLYLVIIHHYLEALVWYWKVPILLTECCDFASFSSLYQTRIFINMFCATSSTVWRAANWGRTDLRCEQWLYHITPSWEFSSWQMPEDGNLLEGWHSCGNDSSELTNEEPFRSKKKFWSKGITSTPVLGLCCWSLGLKTCHLQEFSTRTDAKTCLWDRATCCIGAGWVGGSSSGQDLGFPGSNALNVSSCVLSQCWKLIEYWPADCNQQTESSD